LPHLRDPSFNLRLLWKLFKELIGKDIARFSMPVFINEPLSNLQKTAEYFAHNNLLEEAA